MYKKKFEILASDYIVTAGSCFAQHIGNRLQSSGFNYLDVEPSPCPLSDSDKKMLGYGVYSARYGNVYTSRQFVQLIERALGKFSPKDQDWENNGRYFDAFRPTFPPGGYETLEEMQFSRECHLAAVAKMLKQADIFVFTFGLTESWESKADGAAYPLCPGTAAGEFSEDSYVFKNYSVADVLQDMNRAIDLITAINPTIKFIFTVSPVPLVATASGDHVLAATTYSKSVLRAAAGELAMALKNVDYFPSYEIISSSIMRGMFFEPDVRSVVPQGVDYVMTHFFKQHRPINAPKQAQKEPETAQIPMHNDDIMCDEILLERNI
ncbi:GSCFA domain-containing protein [Pararhodobacter sp.]|uniref:GSCFA domain-containing protein n=1 Tax=Pararhodobacter sp. TaxID=2127056 RepID=UPI002AFECF64|nr:GSCFA domain-containing protein [Pararhodobacter sp.]